MTWRSPRPGTAAVGLYYRCGIYVARKLLDGFVPDSTAAQYGTPEWIKRLTDAGLWETAPGGYYMPLYFAHGNPTRDKVLADRKAKSERQQRWLENKRNASTKQRRVSRPSNRPSSEPSRVGSNDIAQPPSLTGRKGSRARAAHGAGGDPPNLQAVPAEDQHPFKPDGSGTTCEVCRLPESNRHHLESA